MEEPREFAELFREGARGNRDALDRAMPLLYEELRRLARIYLSRERKDHTLQPTALVHEAYMRLLGQQSVDWSNKGQFLGIAAQMMRRILVNHAEARSAAKRNPEGTSMPIPGTDALGDRIVDYLTLDRALQRLKQIDERQEKIIELRCYAGLTLEETAEVMELSLATIKREWSVALLWIRRELAVAEKP